MNVRWMTSKAVLLLVALIALGAARSPQTASAEATTITPFLRFGQSLALSDFDSDGLIDEARIDGQGSHKRVRIALSHESKRLVLHFDVERGDQGSLFAGDVDNDGATDLVWTDLLHPGDVIVWLGDGAGQFERVSSKPYGERFTLGALNVSSPEGSTNEPAVGSTTRRELDQLVSHKAELDASNEIVILPIADRCTSSPALSQPVGRSPPLFF